jgi:hypothetical protein
MIIFECPRTACPVPLERGRLGRDGVFMDDALD